MVCFHIWKVSAVISSLFWAPFSVLWGRLCCEGACVLDGPVGPSDSDYFSSVFSFCSSVSIIFIVLFQVLCFFSACSNLPLNLYWIFHLLLSFSVLEFLFGFFSGFLSLYWCFFTLFSFSTSSFSSLSTFRTVVFVWCICHLDFSQRQFLLICVFLWMGHISCFFMYLVFFFVVVVEQQTFESNNVITPKIRFSPFPGVCLFCVLSLV